MKKLIALMIAVIALTSCEIQRSVNAEIFPTVISHVEIYNGSVLIADYNDVQIEMVRMTSTAVLGANEYFLIYKVYKNNKLIKSIMDSEALTIVWE